ncbi:alpha/beta hydrolase [Egibacter rhizosphaerae]|uniref:Alpha/beta hydrolase n=1 Tax=Egibacter rhizosphaerae TaxID=1670831 RepID=A0A411YCL9_9ACTN|nr:alpha/beta hydrolase [Egibacter rhizosphaerae]QBI18981.1 alpha/beta hydrolase [Egibacter rhizosphaerae]
MLPQDHGRPTQRTRRVLRGMRRGIGLGVGGALVGGYIVASRPRPPTASRGVAEPPPGLPPGRTLALPGRGEMFLRETPAPSRDAPTLALLHGWMFPSDLHWAAVAPGLARRARLVIPDHRGHGRGSRPAAPFRLTDVADDVAALLRRLDTGPAILVGYSMGGAIAMHTWQRHPDVVRGLVLCATSSNYADSPAYRLVWRSMGGLQLLLRLLPRHQLESLLLARAEGRLPIPITRMIHQETPREVVQRLPWLVGEFDRGSADDVAEAGRELGRFDGRGWIPTIDVPTGVVVTSQDRLVPPNWQYGLAALLPGAPVRTIHADHDAVIAAPGILEEAISGLVTDLGLG